MENKFKMTLQSLLEGDANEIGEEIQRQVKNQSKRNPLVLILMTEKKNFLKVRKMRKKPREMKLMK